MAGAHAAGAPKHAAPKGPKHAGARAPKGSTSSGAPRHSGGPRHAAPKPKTASGLSPTAQGRLDAGARTVAKPVTSGFNFAWGQTRSFAGSAAASGGKALPFLLAATFLIVALAKIRGNDALDIPKAFFGGLILAFFLTMLALWNKRLATLFAGLVLIGVTLEFGPTAFGGIFTGATTPLSAKGFDLPNPSDLTYKTVDGKKVKRSKAEQQKILKQLQDATNYVGDDGMPGSLSDLPPMVRDQILKGNG